VSSVEQRGHLYRAYPYQDRVQQSENVYSQ